MLNVLKKIFSIIGLIISVLMGLIGLLIIIIGLSETITSMWIFGLVLTVLSLLGGIYCGTASRFSRFNLLKKERERLTRESNLLIARFAISNDYVHMVCIDDSKKKWSYYNSLSRQTLIFTFDQFTDFEVIENGNSIIQGRSGSTLVGGFFDGYVGALAGASRKRKIDQRIYELIIKLFVNDIENPCILIKLIKRSTKKPGRKYKSAIDKVIQFESIFKIIMANNKKAESNINTIKSPVEPLEMKEQLQKLKEMLDEGLITQEDYEQKKKQILEL